MGKTYIYYLFNTITGESSFYNQEPEAVDSKEPTAAEKRFLAIENYLNTNFVSFFIVRFHSVGSKTWVEADVYTGTDSLTKSTIIATKLGGSNPVTHKAVI